MYNAMEILAEANGLNETPATPERPKLRLVPKNDLPPKVGDWRQPRHIGMAETNRLIRKALKDNFPGVKFSVRGRKYAGGCSTDIRWTGGPAADEVEKVAGLFEGKSFDGRTDSTIYHRHWMKPDGSIGYAPTANDVPEGADAVYFATGYIFCRRNDD